MHLGLNKTNNFNITHNYCKKNTFICNLGQFSRTSLHRTHQNATCKNKKKFFNTLGT